MTMPLDDKFESLLRRYLGESSMGVRLDPEVSLSALGLDSHGIVELVADLETTYGIVFSDETLTAETFATPSSVWAAVVMLIRPNQQR